MGVMQPQSKVLAGAGMDDAIDGCGAMQDEMQCGIGQAKAGEGGFGKCVCVGHSVNGCLTDKRIGLTHIRLSAYDLLMPEIALTPS